MKRLMLNQVTFTLLSCLFLGLFLKENVEVVVSSYFMGSLLMTMNICILWWSWNRIFAKKFIALAVSVIVIKYAIFAVIIYKILKIPNIQPIWFSFGISTFMVSAIIEAAFFAMEKSEMKAKIKEEEICHST